VVGQWSYRKGVDTLVTAIGSISNVRLIHVGSLIDAPFPVDPRFVHYDHVPQQELPRFYEMADVLVLPSREDGFGVVLSQALASGLQIVCTERTGGPDLAKLSGLARLIRIVPVEDVTALRRAIQAALESLESTRKISSDERESLSWRGYAERDLQFMKACLA
jgi:glycosyltransferase involved in cell wall biosynthesis